MRYTESSRRLSHLFNSIVGVVCILQCCNRCILRGNISISVKMLQSQFRTCMYITVVANQLCVQQGLIQGVTYVSTSTGEQSPDV